MSPGFVCRTGLWIIHAIMAKKNTPPTGGKPASRKPGKPSAPSVTSKTSKPSKRSVPARPSTPIKALKATVPATSSGSSKSHKPVAPPKNTATLKPAAPPHIVAPASEAKAKPQPVASPKPAAVAPVAAPAPEAKAKPQPVTIAKPVAPIAPAPVAPAKLPEVAASPLMPPNPAIDQAGPTMPATTPGKAPPAAPVPQSILLQDEYSRISDRPQRDYTTRTTTPERELPAVPTSPGSGDEGPLPLLFEIGWEVCWQLGGIYTVLRTKATSMIQRWGDRYFLIGPYNPQTAAVEFEEQPTEGFIRQTLDQLRSQGIPCHYGRWLVPGRPRVILLDYRARFAHMDSDKYFMWKDHGITMDPADGEVNEVVAFGFTVAEFFRNLMQFVKQQPVLAHFHEWMGGVAVPRLAHMQLPITTVFTTHATLLGRYLAADNPYFYQHLPFLDGEREAQHYNIYPRFQIEKAAAHAATVFTTVSEVTAYEAEKLLLRKPEVILPNGLNIQRFAALHEFQNLHREYKEKINEFVMSHFFPAYTFDLDNTIYLFTSGRYEYRNKGMDIFIEAMHRLNWRLKGMADHPTVVAFIVTRAPTRSLNVNVLQNHSMFEDLRATCASIREQMGESLFMGVARGRIPGLGELLTDDAQVRLKRVMHAYRTGRQPAIVTHDMVDDAGDAVLKHLRLRQLFNAPDDPVKMVFHPDFISATSPLWHMEYEQFVRGCHVGIFPSYYEPWGYTPMESIAMGVPAVTSDLSGFGAYVERQIPNYRDQGILVVNRRTQNFDQSTNDLVDYLYNFVQMSRRQRIEMRNRVERTSESFDWSVLTRHYDEAHALALSRRGIQRPGTLEVRVI